MSDCLHLSKSKLHIQYIHIVKVDEPLNKKKYDNNGKWVG